MEKVEKLSLQQVANSLSKPSKNLFQYAENNLRELHGLMPLEKKWNQLSQDVKLVVHNILPPLLLRQSALFDQLAIPISETSNSRQTKIKSKLADVTREIQAVLHYLERIQDDIKTVLENNGDPRFLSRYFLELADEVALLGFSDACVISDIYEDTDAGFIIED